ncbi:MAG: sugar phosphate isomerase/epimerase family protein [Pirellulales bacterium]
MQHNETCTPSNSIKLAGAAWSWVGATLAESAAIYRALGVDALDLIAVPGSRFDTYQLAADPRGQARRLTDLGVALSNLLVFFGTDFRDRALNSHDSTVRSNNLETFRRVLEFCAAAGFYSVTVLPGVEQHPFSRKEALKWTAIELSRMNELAKDAGVLLVYEPHVQSILENPHDVLKFARENSDVKLVIDYSHAVSLGHTSNELDPLVPYAGHVHLRQAAPDKIQARWEEGVIDFPAFVGLLKQIGYQGYLTLEYEHDKFWNMDRCDVMAETIKMRDVVLPCLC